MDDTEKIKLVKEQLVALINLTKTLHECATPARDLCVEAMKIAFEYAEEYQWLMKNG